MNIENTNQRPKYQRAEIPPPMRFQQRDTAILEALYGYDGVLARRHIKMMFWPIKSIQSMENRLSKLFHNGYINWPSKEHRMYKPIPEPIIWLGWRGAMVIAQNRSAALKPPKNENENQMRLLQRALRKHNISWVREPKWIQLQHDLTVVDFRLAVERSIREFTNLSMSQWILESEFRTNLDVIEFSFKAKGDNKIKRKGVCPDGLFILADDKRRKKQQNYKAHFLLELDMATHDNPSFGIEKAAAGAAYIKSPEYKRRFGTNAGGWLVVTTGETRMKNLIKQTKYQAEKKARFFYFTTQDKIEGHNILADPIWWQVGKDEPLALPFSLT